MNKRKVSTTHLSDLSLAVVYAPDETAAPAVRNGRQTARLNKLAALAVYAPDQVCPAHDEPHNTHATLGQLR